ncbi:MAG TPA: glycosyltransferase [Solirubrobacteraceae bacterium]|jgi:UDP-N-acetylglucosamine transferase subunit ALG13|nr:glycosyltransferase [Solirubrobacteraceae bacterium]
MIFVTVGSIHYPFARLVDAAAKLDGEVVIQHGPAAAPRGVSRAVDFLPFDEVADYMRRAEVIVTHAGVGSIVLAAQNGHVPVVMPRLRRFGETVDDHQVPLVELLAAHGTVVPALEPAEVAGAVGHVPERAAPQPPAERSLHHEVRAALEGTGR